MRGREQGGREFGDSDVWISGGEGVSYADSWGRKMQEGVGCVHITEVWPGGLDWGEDGGGGSGEW